MIKNKDINLVINNKRYSANIEPRLLLVDFLRYNLKLTGTHVGCDTSQCGSCIVTVDGQCVKSCTTLAVQCNNKNIRTVESLGSKNELHQIQQAFKNNHGLQCGFCTPGILFTAIELKKVKKTASEKEIRTFLDGNLCRCTGYHNIIKSIKYFLDSKQADV